MKEIKNKGGILAYLLNSEEPAEKRLEIADLIGAVPTCSKYRTHACTGFCDSIPHIRQHLGASGDAPDHSSLIESHGLTIGLPDRPPGFATAKDLVSYEKARRQRHAATATLLQASKKVQEGADHFSLVKLLEGAIEGIKAHQPKSTLSMESAEEMYNRRLLMPDGPKLGVDIIDDLIEGLEPGTLCTLAGFVGSFKTTWLLNALYLNATDPKRRFNGTFLTLEIPRDVLVFELLSRHSYDTKFRGIHPPVPYRDLLKRRVTKGGETWEFLFKTVSPDLFENPEYGRIEVVEEANLDSLSMRDIRRFLASRAEPTQLFCLDYAQLMRYVDNGGRVGDIASIDIFVRQLAEMLKDFEGGRIAGIVAAQTNRDGWVRATASGGQYDLKALSEARELERSSRYICFTYADEALISSGVAKVSLHKQNLGEVHQAPIETYVNPAFAVFGDHEGLTGPGIVDYREIFDINRRP